jgi:hypothetical protein
VDRDHIESDANPVGLLPARKPRSDSDSRGASIARGPFLNQTANVSVRSRAGVKERAVSARKRTSVEGADKAIAEFGAAIARASKTAQIHEYRERGYEAQNKPHLSLADYWEADATDMMAEPSNRLRAARGSVEKGREIHAFLPARDSCRSGHLRRQHRGHGAPARRAAQASRGGAVGR